MKPLYILIQSEYLKWRVSKVDSILVSDIKKDESKRTLYRLATIVPFKLSCS